MFIVFEVILKEVRQNAFVKHQLHSFEENTLKISSQSHPNEWHNEFVTPYTESNPNEWQNKFVTSTESHRNEWQNEFVTPYTESHPNEWHNAFVTPYTESRKN